MVNKKYKIQRGKWLREFDYDFDKREFFTIYTDKISKMLQQAPKNITTNSEISIFSKKA